MGLHIYGIVPAGHTPAPGLQGLGDAAVEVLTARSVAFWVSRHDDRPAASIDAARRHNAVIHSAMTQDVTPVPARFGQWFDSDDAALEKLAADESKWRAELDRFVRRAEYGVRVTATQAGAAPVAAQDVHPADGGTGTRYMQSLARRHAASEQREREAARIADDLAAAAGATVVERRVRTTEDGVAVSHLVAWEDASPYHSAMRREEARRRDLRFLFTGPWPPYSFVE